MFTDFFASLPFSLDSVPKLLLLLALGFYVVFALIAFNQVRSLNRIFFISSSYSSRIVVILAFLHLLAAISLFFLTLAIL